MPLRALLSLFLCAAAAGTSATAQPIAIEHVTVIDGLGRAPQPDMTVVIDGERIVSVAPSALGGAAGARAIDGRGKFLMPGLMDMHIHLSGAFDPTRPRDGKPGPVNKAAGIGALASYLYAGVTSVYDAGNRPELILALRAEERAGKIASPRIFASGNLITYPGGHGASVGIGIDSWPQAKAALDRHIAGQKPDIAKLVLEEEGWGSRPLIPMMPVDLLQQVTEYYNQHGIRTTVHVSSELRALEAIYAGVDTLAHPVIQGPVSDSFVALMAAKKTPFVTTLTIGDNYGRLVDHPDYLDQPLYAASLTPQERERLRTEVRDDFAKRAWTGWMRVMTPIAMENVRKIDAAGGIAAAGTDQSTGAALHRELELLEAAGIKPLEVIRIATHNSALFLGRADDMGSVEVGKLADLVLLDKDPSADIDNAKAISLVIKGGSIIDESNLPLPGGKIPAPGPR
ncbi:MAG: amidohydrolase family protein [Alphaproteobacteria bacterium]